MKVPRILSISPPDPAGAAAWVAAAPRLVAAGVDGLLLRVLVADESRIGRWLDTLMACAPKATVLVHGRSPDGVRWARERGLGLHLPDGAPLDRPHGVPLLGASRHTVTDLDSARACDYVVFGPVFAPVSYRSQRAPHGIEGLVGACGVAQIPVLALGGVDSARAADCLDAGAWGVAGIGAFGPDADLAGLAIAAYGGGAPP